MININEVIETNAMIEKENLDVRTITLGISLIDCISDNLEKLCDNIYEKITTVAEDLVKTGNQIEREYALPIVNKRISVTPVSIIGASACRSCGEGKETSLSDSASGSLSVGAYASWRLRPGGGPEAGRTEDRRTEAGGGRPGRHRLQYGRRGAGRGPRRTK